MEEKRNRLSSIFCAIFLALSSLFISGICFYFCYLGVYWFIPIAIYFLLESTFIIVPLFIKDDYLAMHLQGIYQIISVLVMMVYLLFLILWNDANNLMNYSLYIYLILAGLGFFKLLTALVSHLLIVRNYHPLLHAYRNNAFISVFYLALIIVLIISNQFYPGNSVKLFDNLLKEKPLWIYIINIACNALFTPLAALLALSTDIRAKEKEELNTKEKIKHTIRWFNDHEISMFFSLIFTLYLAVLSLINIKQSIFYILLFIYYLASALIRIINYLWHHRIKKSVGDNQIKENRLSSWILLFDAGAYLVFSNILVLASIFMMIQKADMGTNIYLFLFFNIPMLIMRLITSNKSVRRNRKENNTYRLGLSLISIVTLFFKILETIAFSCHNLSIIWLRYTIIILAIIAVKIAVIVVAIIFVIHWIRSIILNSKRKERRLNKQKELQ